MSNLGNKAIMAKNIRYYMNKFNVSQTEICNTLGIKMPTFSDWVNEKTYPRIDKIELMANYFGISKADLVEEQNSSSNQKPNRINVYGSVPAGIPIEAVEDIVDWEDIPMEWLKGDQRYIGLRVKGDSMFPKYIEDDTIIVKLQPDCESGQDAVVYVNGDDARLKKVVKNEDGIMLQPLNPEYVPKQYDYNDERYPISILGIVVEIRRKV